jgi:hypothetical protein
MIFFLKFDEILGLKPLLKLLLVEILFIAIALMLLVFKNTKMFQKIGFCEKITIFP